MEVLCERGRSSYRASPLVLDLIFDLFSDLRDSAIDNWIQTLTQRPLFKLTPNGILIGNLAGTRELWEEIDEARTCTKTLYALL